MKNTVDIDIQIDPAYHDPKVVILTERNTQDIENIVCAIENCMDSGYPMVPVRKGNVLEFVSQREIIRIYYENRRLLVHTDRGRFIARKTLGEMELMLNKSRFQRISRSEIINLKKVARFDFNKSGAILVTFDDGASTWVARRYVSSIQRALESIQGGTRS